MEKAPPPPEATRPDQQSRPDHDEPQELSTLGEDQNVQLTEIGAKMVEIYQKQAELSDRVWSYFSQYTTMLIVLSFLLLLYGPNIKAPWWVWAVPFVGYVIFACGNHRALKSSLDELFMLRGAAVGKSGLRLQKIEPSSHRRFHIALSVFALLIYLWAWIYV